MTHWTSANKAFIHRITFDFIAQLEKQIELLEIKQSELAKRLDVSEGSVSQVLNSERENLTLKTMVSYASALGMKVAIVAYDDKDPRNEYGPVGSEIFSMAWEKLGSPRDIWSLKENAAVTANHAGLPIIWESFLRSQLSRLGTCHTTWNGSDYTGTTSDLTVAFQMDSLEQRTTLTNA